MDLHQVAPEKSRRKKAPTWRLLVVDGHPLILEGITSILAKFLPSVRAETAASVTQGMEKTAKANIDLVLLDLGLPDVHGFSAITDFHQQFPSLSVAVLSSKKRADDVRCALHAGAQGFIPKSLPVHELIVAIRKILGGEIYVPSQKPDAMRKNSRAGSPSNLLIKTEQLTLRQFDVLTQLCHGKSNAQIAMELSLSEKTVKSHVTTIFRAFGVVSRTQAVLVAKQLGLSR